MISQSRWDVIIEDVKECLVECWYDHSVDKLELELIMSVLKNNTPFQVVPDCCLGNNNQQVGKPNKETIEAMNDDAALETNIVVFETKNFSVIDNGDMNV